MTEKAIPTIAHRGTLQPAIPPIEALKCDACGGWWFADPSEFGCPHCARARELLEHQT